MPCELWGPSRRIGNPCIINFFLPCKKKNVPEQNVTDLRDCGVHAQRIGFDGASEERRRAPVRVGGDEGQRAAASAARSAPELAIHCVVVVEE